MRDELLLGPYRLDDPLGGGGMGDVLAATHTRWGHALAVKIARATLAESSGARPFHDEVRAVAALDHPHVVRIYDQGVVSGAEADASGGRLAAGTPWLAMERARGTLEPPDDWETLRRALSELLDGLAAAHAEGILHLDVKPSNVLVRADGSHALADFGIVVLRDALGGSGSPTWGSPPYMAPERFDGCAERLVEATDLYAVGCVGFFLAHRATPFPCPSWAQAAAAHRAEAPPPLEPRVPVPDGFEGWLRILLAKRPGDRFQTAADARHALLALGRPAVAAAGSEARGEAGPLTVTAPGEPVPFEELVVTEPPPGVAPLPERWVLRPRPRRLESVGLGLLGLLAVPFTGRERAREALWGALRAVTDGGRPRLVVLGGPRGVGRTRLGDAFAHAAAEGSAAVVRVRSGQAVVDALRVAAGVTGDLGMIRACEGVALRIGRSAGDPETTALAEACLGRRPAAEGLARLARRIGEGRPVVLWVDDALDAPERVALVAAALADGGPVLVVAAAADQARRVAPERAARLDGLGGTPIHLAPLDVPTARQLLADWVGLGAELVADLAERCEGDVGLALEMVRDGVRSGRLVQGTDGLRATEVAPLPLPPAAIAAWRSHLPPLDDALRTALERAAVLGAAVDREALTRAVGDRATCEALERRVLEEGLAVPTETGWRWPSPALRACILADAGPRLPDHHLAAAEVAAGPDASWVRGSHLLSAGRVHEAVPLLLAASSDVIAAGRMAEAARRLQHLQRALEGAAVPESDPAWGGLWRAFGTLGPTHLGYAACRAYSERAAALARRYPDDPAWRDIHHNAVGGLAWLANVQLLPKEARRWLDEQATLLRANGAASAYYQDTVGWWALTVGDAALSKRSFAEAVRLASASGNTHLVYVSDASLGVAKRHAGDADAVAHLERAGAAMLEAGWLSARADLAAALGDAERHRGNLEAARAHYEEALRASAEGEARADPGFRVGHALLLRELGDLDGARAELEAVRAHLDDEGPTWEGLVALHLAAVAGARWDDDAFDDVPAAVGKLLETGFVDPDLAASASYVADRAWLAGETEAAEAATALARVQHDALRRGREGA